MSSSPLHPSPAPEGGFAPGVLQDLGSSPTPYHAVERAASLLLEAGYREIDLSAPFPTEPGGRFVRNGGSLAAWHQQAEHSAFTVVGAHTDSPNLRVKSSPDVVSAGTQQVGMETYGSPLLNSWLDRGLGLAGRVMVRVDGGLESRLVLDDRPILVIPQLAIHLDRDVNREGLKLNPQKHLVPVWALDAASEASDGPSEDAGPLRRHLSDLLDSPSDDILSWDLMAFDTQPPEVIGRTGELFASGRIDNLLSTFCGVRALIEAGEASHAETAETPVLALYDHEEIGSESATGAAGNFLAALLERIAAAQGASRSEYLASLHRSLVVSADGAHATHPNYADRHEPQHHIALNGGVVIKRNANHRYATEAPGEARVVAACQDAGVPLQYYIHRNDLPCGSTIGPLTAARLGVTTVDLGAPQLGMHSCRETAGVADVDHLATALSAVWASSTGK